MGSIMPEYLPNDYPEIPKVPVLDQSSTNVQEIVQALIRAGGCVLRGAVSPEDLAQIEQDTRPWIIQDLPSKATSIFPDETRLVCGLAAKSKAFVDKVVCHELYQGVCNELLSRTFKSWWGGELKEGTSKPQLNNTVVFSIGPGAPNQPLHRDDTIHHNVLEQITAEEYKYGRDTGIGFFVAGKKTTKANGATRFIPGSHLWGALSPAPIEDLTFYAELQPGDAFIMLASAYHGGSANTTEAEERLVYSCFMTRGYLKQEENQYLANDQNKLKEMHDMETLNVIGYALSVPSMGWVNFDSPLKVLLGDKAKDAGEILGHVVKK